MGMAGPDIVLFVVGFVLFAGAGYALVAQGDLGGGGSPTGAYSVLFPLSKVEAGKANVPDFGTSSVTVPVTLTNVSKVTVTFACNDVVPASGTFTVQVNIEPPNGLEKVTKGATCSGKMEFDVPVASVPPPTAVAGRDKNAAAATLGSDANATRAAGDWKISVSGARGGTPVGLPAGNPSGTVTLVASQWAPELTPVVK